MILITMKDMVFGQVYPLDSILNSSHNFFNWCMSVHLYC